MQSGYEREILRFQQDLESSLYKDAETKHRKKLIEIKVGMIDFSCGLSQVHSEGPGIDEVGWVR